MLAPPPIIALLSFIVLSVILSPVGPVDAEAPASVGAGIDVVRPEEGEVYRLYRSVLDRAPDDDGFGYWVAARVEGVSLRTVADGFLNGREYSRRFGGGSDAEFVDRVYGNVLGRAGDEVGVAYWLAELADGLARTELVLLFSESTENRAVTGTGLEPLPTFRPVIAPVAEADVATSWRPGCPVDPVDLRAVEIDHVGFDALHRRGTLVVNVDVVDDVVAIFATLYDRRYPIEVIAPIDDFGGDDDASMEANNTSAFNCRAVTGGRSWSRHAYGMAVDINPAQNPYVSGQRVLPPSGRDHVDRTAYHPAMIRPGDIVTSSFADAGWRWGGDFRTLSDYQHFER